MPNDESTYMILVIDDLRVPLPSNTDDIVVFTYRTPDDGLAALQEFHSSRVKLDELWLDHDMGRDPQGRDVTITPVIAWLEETAARGKPLDVGHIFVHSDNPYASEQMTIALKRFYPHVQRSSLPVDPKNPSLL